MRLDLSSLDLIVSAPTGPGVAAALKVRTDAGGATAVPDFVMGFGMPVPANVKSAFAALGTIDDGGTWLHTDPARTDQRWFVQWRDGAALVYGETSAAGVEADGLTFRNARLRVVLRSDSRDASLVRIWIEGDAEWSLNPGPLSLRNVAGRFSLEINAESVPDLQRIIDDPASVLGSAFTGRLSISITAARIALLTAVDFHDAEILFAAEASSLAGARQLHLTAATFALGGRLLFAGAQLIQSRLVARIDAWPASTTTPIELEGQGALTLPTSISGSVGGAGIAANVRLQCSTTTTRFEFASPGLRLDPAVNILGLAGVSLKTVFIHDSASDVWSFAAEGTITQSWTHIAEKVRASGLMDLGSVGAFPDARASFSLATQSLPAAGGQHAALRCALDVELLQNGHPYDGPLGDLPVRIVAPRLRIAADITAGRFAPPAVEGQGALSVTGKLASVLPWKNLTLDARLVDSVLPSLRLRVSGMPVFALPPLRRGGASISLLQIMSAELELGARVRFGGAIRVLPGITPPQLVTRLGLPAELGGFLKPMSELLVGLQGGWDLAYDASNGSGSLTISFEKPDAPEMDPFEILRSIFPASGGPGGGFSLGNDFALLRVQPGSARFIITFGGTEETFAQLDSSVYCTVLNERFDARLAFRMSNVAPEIELAAGVEDPISLAFPGLQAVGGNVASTLLTELSRSYTLSNRDRQFLTGAVQQIAAFLAQPGMDTAAQFELRQLRLILRPTDATAPVEVSGVVRPRRLSNFVNKVLPVVPSVAIGATARSVFLELRIDEEPGRPPTPLVRIPLGANRNVDFILHGFRIGYAWDSNSIDLALQLDINQRNLQLFEPAIGTGVLIPQGSATAPSMAAAFTIRTLATVPPVPVPEWNVTFGDVGNPNNRGIELIIGVPNQRLLTLNLRKTAFSITRTIFGPGGDFDGGFLFGNPPANTNDLSQFYLRGSCIEGTFITYPSSLVPLLNPFGTIFPPPIPLGPTTHGDLFFRELRLTVNIPGLIYAGLVLEKPLPQISLLTIIELIFLASKGFTVPLPATSSLRKVFFVALHGDLKLPLPLFGTTSGGRAKMVEVVGLDTEFNAAEVLSAIGQGLNTGEQILKATGQGLDLLTKDPALLLRIVPRDKRSFTFDETLDLPGLKLKVGVSAFLLTPDELREELVLYHESHRPLGKGTSRVRLAAPPPPTSLVIDRIPTKLLEQTFVWKGLANIRDSFNSKGTAFQRYLSGKRATAEEKARQRANKALSQELKPRIRTALRDLFFNGSAPIWNLLQSSTPAKRRSELEKRGMGFAADLVERAIKDLGAAPTPARMQQIWERLVEQIADAAPLSTPEPLDLGEDRKDLAARLASQIVLGVPTRDSRRLGITVINAASRSQIFRDRFTKEEHRPLLRVLEDLGNKTEDRMRTAPPANQAEEKAFRDQVERDILRTLNEQGVRHRPINLARPDEEIFGLKDLDRRIRSMFPDRREMRSTRKSATILDLDRTQLLALKAGLTIFMPAPAGDRVREVVGHQLRRRPDGSSASTSFAVDVLGPHVAYRVEFRQGHFVLVVTDSRNVELSATNLPSSIVGSRTPAPGVAAEITRMFVLVPKVVERAMTADEKAARDDNQQESSPSLYQLSLFAREEYAIRVSGGKRGKLTLADLLCAPGGKYVIPGGPVLIAAGKVGLFHRGSSRVELGVVGLVAMPVGTATSGIFLYGHQLVALPLPFGYELRMEGDFHVVAGDMWPSSLADPSIQRNSVSFAGVAKLRRDGRDIVEGAASGHFRYPSPSKPTDFSLRVAIQVGDSWELEFTDVSFMKASFEAVGDLEIEFADGSLSLRFVSQSTLKWQLAEFATKEIELPSWRVCGPNPLALLPDQPDTICVTVGGGTEEVPDPTRYEWGEENIEDVSVSASLQSGVIRVDVSVARDRRFDYHFEL